MSDLNEFLVSLGYSAKGIEEADKVERKLAKAVAAISKALTRAAAALTAAFAQSSASLDALNWAAQRTGTSVENLKSLAYAYRQTGASAVDAGSAIEAFARQMRTIPSTEGLVRQFGAKTKDGGGNPRDLTDVLLDAVEAINKEPNYVVAAHQASQLGLSETQYQHLRAQLPALKAARAEYDQMSRSMGGDRAKGGRDATALAQERRFASMQIDVMLDALVIAAVPIVKPLMDRLSEWLRANQTQIVAAIDRIIDIVSSMLDALGAFVVALAPVAEAFTNFIEATTGENGIVIALEAFMGAWLASVALRMFGVGGKVRVALAALVAAMVIGKHVASGSSSADLGGLAGVGGEAKQGGGFFSRAIGRVKSAFGFGEAPHKDGPKPAEGPMLDRSVFAEELKDPSVRQRLFAVTQAEVGGYGEDDYVAFMETIFNRAKARGQTLWETLHGSYFPAQTHNVAAAQMGNPKLEEKYRSAFDRVMGGSNTMNGATGNASGRVGFGGGPLMWRSPHGEGYGIEAPDLPWWRREQERLKKQAPVGPQSSIAPTTPWGNPNESMKSSPITTSGDEQTVNAGKTTRITVKGDTDPHRTASDVFDAQRRTHMDLITSTNRAFA